MHGLYGRPVTAASAVYEAHVASLDALARLHLRRSLILLAQHGLRAPADATWSAASPDEESAEALATLHARAQLAHERANLLDVIVTLAENMRGAHALVL